MIEGRYWSTDWPLNRSKNGPRNRVTKAALTAVVAALLSACSNFAPPRPPAPSQPEAPSGFRSGLLPQVARHFMAAAANPMAAEAGRRILAAGGSAVDAAIAMQMVLTLVEPQSSGIGGGAFLLHWDGQRVQAFDGRETAPMAADENLFLTADGRAMDFYEAVVGGLAVGTPGVLRMLERAHRQHGRLPWARLFEPAIRLSENGFALPARLASLLADEKHLRASMRAREYFYLPDGRPRQAGQWIRNPELAATLRSIAVGGADAFYRGPIAADIVATVRSHPIRPGRLAVRDLERYEAKERPALCTDYKRWRVCGMGPPSSGGLAVAQMLGIFARRNIAVVPPATVGDRLVPQPDAIHLFSEAGRLAFADRALHVADPDFVAVDVTALTDRSYLDARARLVSDRSMGRAVAGAPGPGAGLAPDRSAPRTATSHLSAVDAFGNAVAMTTSIEDAFGSRQMVRGFLLNNQLTDFSFLPREVDGKGSPRPEGAPVANRVEPGKRPRSSMAPTLVFDRSSGELVATLGSPGGSQIINYVAKTLVGVLDWNLDIQQAIALPNFGSRNLGPTEVELGRVDSVIIDALRDRAHDVRAIPMTSGIQGIVRIRDPAGRALWSGGADPRREGVALGD